MKKTALHIATVVLFCASQSSFADTTSSSSSGAVSGSSSTSQGGGSSLNTLSNTSTSTGGHSSATGGTSNVNVSVRLAQASTGGLGSSGTPAGSSSSLTSKAATDGPGTSAFDTRATVDQNINQGSYSVRSTPSIGAPALTTTLSDTCMGSTSFGVSVTGFGLTGGTTQVDEACVRRLDAREFRAMGLTDVALALLCQSASNRRAVEATGHLCPGTKAPLAKVMPDEPQISEDEKYRDPLVRTRLGLEPLDVQPVKVQVKQAKPVPPVPVVGRIEPASVETTPVKDAKSAVVATLK